MKYSLETHSVRKQITSHAQGAQHINVGQETLGAVKVYFPSIKEQEAIGEYFFELNILITLHQQKIEALNEIKKAMLQKMFPQSNSIE